MGEGGPRAARPRDEAEVRPYPFDRWPKVTSTEAEGARHGVRGDVLATLLAGAPAARAWLGAPLVVRADAAGMELDAIEPLCAVLLEGPGGRRVALCLDPTIASALVDRALGGDGEELEGATGALRELERGVLAYAVARWIAGHGSYGVATVLTSKVALDAALGARPRHTVALALELGTARGRGALVGDTGAPARVDPGPWLTSLPVEHAVVGGHATLDAGAIAALSIGDVVLPDRAGLHLERGEVAGEVLLVASEARRAARATLARGELRVVEIVSWAPPSAATREGRGMKETLEDFGGTPVTLTLELARVTLPLGEASALCPGEIVRTGTPIGGEVLLRAGDRVIARGELVDVEGEVGVRILSLG